LACYGSALYVQLPGYQNISIIETLTYVRELHCSRGQCLFMMEYGACTEHTGRTKLYSRKFLNNAKIPL